MSFIGYFMWNFEGIRDADVCPIHIFMLDAWKCIQENIQIGNKKIFFFFFFVEIKFEKGRKKSYGRCLHNKVVFSLTNNMPTFNEANKGKWKKKSEFLTILTLGMLSLEQTPSWSNLSRISHANMLGHSRL